MGPDDLRVAINAYLDKGPDFIKYGGTSHTNSLITFSPRQQEVLVEETHKRGKFIEVHSTNPEPLLMSVLAGIDLIQHPEVHNVIMPDELVELIVERDVICALLSNTMTGRPWQEYQEAEERRLKSFREDSLRRDSLGLVEQESTEWHRRRERLGITGSGSVFRSTMGIRRTNAHMLIERGCRIVASTDTYLGSAPEFNRTPRDDDHYMPGTATLAAIEGMVELGMTPSDAIVAATKNGAIAAQGLDEYGTLEVGKLADILLLDANPLADITNIRKLSMVMRDGVIVDTERLPEKPVWYRPR
jgi:imidazolonepropionase-like amidohydrolase